MVEWGWLIVLVAVVAVGLCSAVCWWMDRTAARELDEFDEYMRERTGDATETPTVLHQTRRANHAKPR